MYQLPPPPELHRAVQLEQNNQVPVSVLIYSPT